MAIPLRAELKLALGDSARECQSRSLYIDRFADPSSAEKERHDWFEKACRLRPVRERVDSCQCWLKELKASASASMLEATLQSRLLVNMAGGVMENAGLCIDRFGVPYIPGSAVKGCARKYAIHALLQLSSSGASDSEVGGFLADVARVFGCSKDDWDKSNESSDFVGAVGAGRWPEVARHSASVMLGVAEYAGAVSFLAAYPVSLPQRDLELDILTCHHPDYYTGKTKVALDDEDPNPVVFPAVAAGITFSFLVIEHRHGLRPLPSGGKTLHKLASEWLRSGLASFGIGAKTAAGYGWMVSSESSPQKQASQGGAAAQGSAREHPIVLEWKGKTDPPNFRVFRPLLAAIPDDAVLNEVFQKIMPPNELAKMTKKNQYWQSFVSHADGAKILKRLKRELK